MGTSDNNQVLACNSGERAIRTDSRGEKSNLPSPFTRQVDCAARMWDVSTFSCAINIIIGLFVLSVFYLAPWMQRRYRASFAFKPLTLHTVHRPSTWRRVADAAWDGFWCCINRVFFREEWALYSKLRKDGALVQFDFDDNFYRFYRTIHQKPVKAEIQANRLYLLSHESSDYAHLLQKNANKNKHFDLGSLDSEAFTRFIELLEPATLYQFSKTSKAVYSHCLNIRGLEYSVLKFKSYSKKEEYACSGSMCYCKHECTPYAQRLTTLDLTCGRFAGYADAVTRKQGLMDLVTCRDVFQFEYSEKRLEQLTFQKKYTHLMVRFDASTFAANFTRVLDCLVHDGVCSIKLVVTYVRYHFLMLDDLISFLEKCSQITQIVLVFDSAYTWDGNHMQSVPFTRIQTTIEEWALSRQDLEYVEWVHWMNILVLHEKKLKCVRQLLQGRYYLVDEYDIKIPLHLYARRPLSSNLQYRFTLESKYLDCHAQYKSRNCQNSQMPWKKRFSRFQKFIPCLPKNDSVLPQ